jgi:dynein-related subfamily AAA family protein
MNAPISLSQRQLPDFLLRVALRRPVFVWGPPGTGKSSLVQQFANEVGLPCVSLLGSQLAPEDLIGVPQIVEGKSRFCPPRLIAREEPYCLFLDELNACSHEVQKSFYSLIHERRVGDYVMPPGSIVVGAGNRAQDRSRIRTGSPGPRRTRSIRSCSPTSGSVQTISGRSRRSTRSPSRRRAPGTCCPTLSTSTERTSPTQTSPRSPSAASFPTTRLSSAPS